MNQILTSKLPFILSWIRSRRAIAKKYFSEAIEGSVPRHPAQMPALIRLSLPLTPRGKSPPLPRPNPRYPPSIPRFLEYDRKTKTSLYPTSIRWNSNKSLEDLEGDVIIAKKSQAFMVNEYGTSTCVSSGASHFRRLGLS